MIRRGTPKVHAGLLLYGERCVLKLREEEQRARCDESPMDENTFVQETPSDQFAGAPVSGWLAGAVVAGDCDASGCDVMAKAVAERTRAPMIDA